MWFLDVRFLRVDVIFVVLLISSSSSCVCIAPPPLPPPPQRIQYSSDVLFRFSCVCAKLVLYGIPLLFLLFSPSLSPFSFLSDFSCIFFLRYSLPLMRYLRVISLLIWLSVYLRASLCYLWFIGALISDSVIVRSRYFRSVVRIILIRGRRFQLRLDSIWSIEKVWEIVAHVNSITFAKRKVCMQVFPCKGDELTREFLISINH